MLESRNIGLVNKWDVDKITTDLATAEYRVITSRSTFNQFRPGVIAGVFQALTTSNQPRTSEEIFPTSRKSGIVISDD